tara:strand:- start:67895 stop:68671 length:777 start_codon:yes stop_codon:yes gene_type:complete
MKISMHKIKQIVATADGLTISELDGQRRVQRIVRARHLAMYLVSEITSKPMVEIGMAFGGRDHTTVSHALTSIKRKMAADLEYKQYVLGLQAQIKTEDFGGLVLNEIYIDEIAQAAISAAVRQSKATPNTAIVGELKVIEDALALECDEVLKATARTAGKTEILFFASETGSWSIIEVARPSAKARIIATGVNWCDVHEACKPIAQPAPPRDECKRRNCVKCSKKFTSRHFGERVCPRCRNSSAYRPSIDPRYEGATR